MPGYQVRTAQAPRLAVRVTDALLEGTVVGSFSRLGLSVRSRLLPEFTHDARPSFSGRVALVTGATSGLGLAAATELARRRGTIHLLGRDSAHAAAARRAIIRESGNSEVSYGIADLCDRDSILRFAREFQAEHGRLDVLIHNAGAVYPSYQVDDAGVELTYAGHVVGPFMLTWLLMPQLLAAAPARVIVVSSGGMYAQPLSRSIAPAGREGYRGLTAYARAKRAQVALSAEWARRIPARDVAFHAMHPGWASTPGLATSLPRFQRLAGPLLRTPEQGADTIVWLATAGPARLGSGRFWHDRRPRAEYLLPPDPASTAALASRLWDSVAALALPERGTS